MTQISFSVPFSLTTRTFIWQRGACAGSSRAINSVSHLKNLYELWAVCTRPAGLNGLGLNTNDAQVELGKVRSLFVLLRDTPAIYDEWERLVVRHDAKGKNAHDARLVAAMHIHKLTRLVTFNVSDFSRFTEIQVIDPMREGE